VLCFFGSKHVYIVFFCLKNQVCIVLFPVVYRRLPNRQIHDLTARIVSCFVRVLLGLAVPRISWF